jgi:hypothetical protein
MLATGLLHVAFVVEIPYFCCVLILSKALPYVVAKVRLANFPFPMSVVSQFSEKLWFPSGDKAKTFLKIMRLSSG